MIEIGICGENGVGVSECPEPEAHYVEWSEGEFEYAGIMCERHTAMLRAGQSTEPDFWVGGKIKVTFVRDVRSHYRACEIAHAQDAVLREQR